MCKDVLKWFLRAFVVVAALTVTSCADSPDEEDVVIPECSLSIDGTTIDEGSAATMAFDETGGTKQFSIQTTGEWEITGHENAPQGFALTTSKGEEKYTGKGDETFTVTLGEATTASRFSLTVNVYASIFGQQKVADTQTITIVQTKGGELPVGKVIYANNFDKEVATQTFGTSGNSWPYLDQFEGWKNHEGEGVTEETSYDFKSVSARANSESSGKYSNYEGSGSNNLLFGGSGYFTIQNIAVSSTNLQLTFGTERYAYGETDNTFKNEEFNVTLSADGQSWSAPIAYSFPEGNDTNGKWNLATADFTLPDGTTKLYIKFASTLAGAHRIDDVKLTDGIGGQAITFDGGGDTPTPPTPPTPGDAIYTNNFDKVAAEKGDKGWPYLDQFEGYKNQTGEGVAEVTYDSKGVSARTSGKLSDDSSFSNYAGSGSNNLFFGSNAYFTIQNIAVSTNKLQLTFGTERYDGDAPDNTFKNEEFLVTLSADGKAWSAPITYAFPEGKDLNGKWNLATADFTLPEGTTKLYIKFAATIASALRLDDVTLAAGNGGQEITLEGGGDEPTPSTPGTMTVAELVAKCKAAGSTQTVLDKANDIVVEAVVVTDKDGGNTTANNLAIMAEGATEAGNGVLLFGSGVTNPAEDAFTWKSGDKVKVTLKAGKARACTYNGTYEITGDKDGGWVAIEKIGTAMVTPVEITTVDNLAEYQSMVVKIKDATSPATATEWCTADTNKTHTFTVGGSNLTVYVKKGAAAFVGKQFKASTKGDITGIVTLYKGAAQLAPRTADDVKAFNGEGGGDQPTPPTPAESGVAKYVPAEMGYADKENVSSASLDGGAVTLAFAGGNPAPVYYTNGTSLRCYANSTITVKSDAKISKIVVTRGTGDKGNTLSANVGTWSDDTLTWTGESNEVVLTVNGASGHIRIASMEITYGEGGGSGGGVEPVEPDQPVAGNTASLTLADIEANGPRSYQDFSITAADGSVWTGFCSGTAARLQMGWNTDTGRDASKSYVLVPDAGKVIKKITFTPHGDTTDNRVLAILPVDFEYTGQSVEAVKAAAIACSANTVKGSTKPLEVDLTGKNLTRFMIRAVGGAVYLTNITIEYAE